MVIVIDFFHKKEAFVFVVTLAFIFFFVTRTWKFTPKKAHVQLLVHLYTPQITIYINNIITCKLHDLSGRGYKDILKVKEL